MKTVFKVGDVVYDNTITDCKGEVKYLCKVSRFGISVNFTNGKNETYTLDGRRHEIYPQTLSFKPYSLDICQERPIDLPEVGEEIMVSDRGTSWFLKKFKSYREGLDYPVYVENDNNCYKHFKRLR